MHARTHPLNYNASSISHQYLFRCKRNFPACCTGRRFGFPNSCHAQHQMLCIRCRGNIGCVLTLLARNSHAHSGTYVCQQLLVIAVYVRLG